MKKKSTNGLPAKENSFLYSRFIPAGFIGKWKNVLIGETFKNIKEKLPEAFENK
jgi:hypothetical protein